MDYLNFLNFVTDELGEEFVQLNSPELLNKVFLSGNSDYYSLFESQAWNIDNLSLLISNSNKEQDLYFLKNIKINLAAEDIVKFISSLIDKNYGSILLDLYSSTLKKDDNLMRLFIEKVGTMNINHRLFVNFIRSDVQYRDEIIKALFDNKRYDLLAFVVSDIGKYSGDEKIFNNMKPLIEEHVGSIVKFLKLFKLTIRIGLFKGNYSLFKKFFLEGYYGILSFINYVSMNDISSSIEKDPEMINKIIEYGAVANEEFIDTSMRLTCMKSSSLYLETLLKRKYFKNLNSFNISAWTLENQELYYKIYSSEQDVPMISNTNSLLFLKYKFEYRFSNYFYKTNYADIYSNEIFRRANACVSIGDDIEKGSVSVTGPLESFYRFMSKNRSENLHKLIICLTSGNINNLGLLFDINGITDYFKQYLLFDVDFICNNEEYVLELSKDSAYSTYVRMLKLDENMKKYLFPMHINSANYSDYFDDKTVTRKFVEKVFHLKSVGVFLAFDVLFKCNYDVLVSDTEKNIINKVISIKSNVQREVFLNYCLKNIEELDDNLVNNVYNLIYRVLNSNSFEIREQADNLIKKLVNMNDYLEVFNRLESILTDAAAPEFLKRFSIYKLLYGDKEIKSDYGVTSPVLKSVSAEEADKILLNDLLRISLATNSKDIDDYLLVLEKGEKLYLSIDSKKGDLSFEEKKLLNDYRIRLEFLCKYLLKLEYESFDDDYSTIQNIVQTYFKRHFKGLVIPKGCYIPVNDMILKDILPSGLGSTMLLRSYMAKHSILKTVFEESKNLHDEELTIKKGDFIKGIYSKYLDNIFNYGSLAIEFLGESASQDSTHLDTDMSMIPRDCESIPDLLSEKLTGCTWGDMSLILFREYMDRYGEYAVTKDESGDLDITNVNKNHCELFCYSASSHHWVIRTGFPITYVKAIIASQNYDRAKFIVLKNDFFVPIYDKEGKLIYSFEEYCKDKKKMSGLSYYGNNNYKLSPNLAIVCSDEVVSELDESRARTKSKLDIIYEKLKSLFNKYFKNTKIYVDSVIEKGTAELLNTGSTGRNTNLIGAGDFDFIVRLDQEFINSEDFINFSRELYGLFGKPFGDSKIIRLKDVRVDGIDDLLELDFTIINKNNKVIYSTEMCINDRLNTIRKLYPNEYNLVLANILFAKKFFKELGIYKRQSGGFTAVGIENFVLQHGGSFYDAAVDFVKVASEYPDFSEFKKQFHVYDFGKNYLAYENDGSSSKFPYDDYVFNLTDSSYKKIVAALKVFIESYTIEEDFEKGKSI